MGDRDDDELDGLGDMEDDSAPELSVKATAAAIREARRRLEDRLEERRLQKLIQDYDFEMI